MWFRKRDRVREVAGAIIDGLRDGSLVPDPPLAKDHGVAFPPEEVLEPLQLISTMSLGAGLYNTFVMTPAAAGQARRANRAGVQGTRDMVAAGVSGEPNRRFALV